MSTNKLDNQEPVLRQVETLVQGSATTDGAGVSLTRFLHGPQLQRRLDPFLMLDAFGSDDPDQYIAGFPDHPHRGFETITYMLEGRMLHQDSAGNEGLLNNGDVQWMCAGRGVIHSEIPQQVEGRMEGFQLWLNLPAADKLSQPWYQDISSSKIPLLKLDSGAVVRVIAGQAQQLGQEQITAGAMQRPVTEPLYLDVELPTGASISHAIPASHNAFVQLYRGQINIGTTSLQAPKMAILTNDLAATGVTITATTASRYLVIAGQPLSEPIEQYGPFVMNTKAEIYQAMQDYQQGRF